MVELSTGLEEKLEALQDEVNLLKNEVKQTLVDLREFIMKGRTIFPRMAEDALQTAPPRVPVATDIRKEGVSVPPAWPQGLANQPVSEVSRAETPMLASQGELRSNGDLDAVMMGNIIWWLGTVKRRGLSLEQLLPSLETYEMSGYLTPALAKLILRSFSELDDHEELPAKNTFTPQDYTECLLQLHEIICTLAARRW